MSFETLLSPSSPLSDALEAPALRGSQKSAFSFDALGVLGLGGPVTAGKPLKTPSEKGALDTRAIKAGLTVKPSSPSAVSLPSPPAAPVTSSASDPEAEASPIDQTVTAPAVKPEALGVLSTVAPIAAEPDVALRAGFETTSTTPYGGPLPVATAPRASSAAAVVRPVFPDSRPLAVDESEAPEVPSKASMSGRIRAEVDAPSGRFNVAVSENEGVLNVVAAAPDLTESDRQTLQTIAEETAGDVGLSLGELRLNGLTTRPSFKAS